MNSNRYCIQLYIENKVGCTDRLKWTDYKHSVEELILDNKDKENLSELCHSDAVSYLQKSLISYAEAIYGLRRNRSSWATVKLYYSVFYSIRADILLSNHFIVRCKGYYYSKIKKNEKLKKFTVRKGGGDHQLSILFSNKLHKSGVNTDPLQDGNIDDMIPYFWLMKQREKINYTQKEFTDPNIVSWLQKPLSYFTENKEQDLLEMYDKADDYLYCFDKDHACLAIPFCKLKRIKNTLDSKGIKVNFSNETTNHLRKLANIEELIN